MSDPEAQLASATQAVLARLRKLRSSLTLSAAVRLEATWEAQLAAKALYAARAARLPSWTITSAQVLALAAPIQAEAVKMLAEEGVTLKPGAPLTNILEALNGCGSATCGKMEELLTFFYDAANAVEGFPGALRLQPEWVERLEAHTQALIAGALEADLDLDRLLDAAAAP